jgi:hypothetical protein
MAEDWTPPADNPFAPLPANVALTRINAAIAAAEKSQRYKIGDRELLRGDLRWMYPERGRLEKIVQAAARCGPRLRRVVPF